MGLCLYITHRPWEIRCTDSTQSPSSLWSFTKNLLLKIEHPFTTSTVFARVSRISVWVSSRLWLTIWNMNHDWSLCASHGAGVVASVGFWCECNVQPADGAILQQVGFHAEKKNCYAVLNICLEDSYIEACQACQVRAPLPHATRFSWKVLIL